MVAVALETSSYPTRGWALQNLSGFSPEQPGRGGVNTPAVRKPQQLATHHFKRQCQDNLTIIKSFANMRMRRIRALRRWQECCTLRFSVWVVGLNTVWLWTWICVTDKDSLAGCNYLKSAASVKLKQLKTSGEKSSEPALMWNHRTPLILLHFKWLWLCGGVTPGQFF